MIDSIGLPRKIRFGMRRGSNHGMRSMQNERTHRFRKLKLSVALLALQTQDGIGMDVQKEAMVISVPVCAATCTCGWLRPPPKV